MIGLPFWSWTNDGAAVSNVFSPRRHRRRGVARLLLFFLLNPHWLT